MALALALVEDPVAMAVESLDISQGISPRTVPCLDLTHLPRTKNHTQRWLMVHPSCGTASVAAGQLGARMNPLESKFVMTNPPQDRAPPLLQLQHWHLLPLQHQLLSQHLPLVDWHLLSPTMEEVSHFKVVFS
jgi:hypothetical protein